MSTRTMVRLAAQTGNYRDEMEGDTWVSVTFTKGFSAQFIIFNTLSASTCFESMIFFFDRETREVRKPKPLCIESLEIER